MIEEAVKNLLSELAGGNSRGEAVTLVAATKTRTAAEIDRAVAAGIKAVGENRVQEFRDKHGLLPVSRHFIGHLQTNKVKYLVGQCDLIHSLDRDELAREIAACARKRGVVQPVLVQVNAGREASKGGYPPEAAADAFLRLSEVAELKVEGLMAMLPESDDEGLLAALADETRALYDTLVPAGAHILSMGMSGDWRLCVRHGSNMVRIGTAIFGARNVPAENGAN